MFNIIEKKDRQKGKKNFRREQDSIKATSRQSRTEKYKSEVKNSVDWLTADQTMKKKEKSFYKSHQYYVVNLIFREN